MTKMLMQLTLVICFLTQMAFSAHEKEAKPTTPPKPDAENNEHKSSPPQKQYPLVVSVTPSRLPELAKYDERCPECGLKRHWCDYPDKSNGCRHDFHQYFPHRPAQGDKLRHSVGGNLTYFEARREALRLMHRNPLGWVYKHKLCRPYWDETRSPHWYGKRLNDNMYAVISKDFARKDTIWEISIHYQFPDIGSFFELATSENMLGEYTQSQEKSETCTVAVDKVTSRDNCRVCMEKPKNLALIPCGHKCVCQDCADKLKRIGPNCPICRVPFTDAIQLPSGFQVFDVRRRLADGECL